MKKFSLILIVLAMANLAYADQLPQPIVQGNYIYYPVPINTVQQTQQQQVQQQSLQNPYGHQSTMTNTRATIQDATNIAGDVATGIQTIKYMLNSFKGGY